MAVKGTTGKSSWTGRPATPRTGTKGMPRAERERLMLDYGERAFAERGLNAVSMDEVAAAAGVTKPLIYAYFGSKEGFYAAGIHRAYERGMERIGAAIAGDGTPEERRRRVIQAVWGWIEDYRDHWPFIFGAQAVGGPVAAEAAASRAGMVELIAGFFRDFIPDPAAESEIEPLAEIAVAVNMALANRWTRHPDEPRELQEKRALTAIGGATAGLLGGVLDR